VSEVRVIFIFSRHKTCITGYVGQEMYSHSLCEHTTALTYGQKGGSRNAASYGRVA